MDEIKLEYGNVNNPVKVGDTVRRDTGSWTSTIHALLKYLKNNGFDCVPKVLGIDEKGREILQYIEGEAAVRPWPQTLLSNDGVIQAAKMLRKYHDIVAGFKPAKDAEWRFGKIPLRPGQIIRHGDLGPWNTIWQEDELVALIDWDFAQPGERVDDLAQLAYYFVPLRGDEGWKSAGFKNVPDLAGRLRILVESYGMFTPEEVLDALLKIQESDRIRTKDLGQRGIDPWVRFLERGDLKESLGDTNWLKSTRTDLLS